MRARASPRARRWAGSSTARRSSCSRRAGFALVRRHRDRRAHPHGPGAAARCRRRRHHERAVSRWHAAGRASASMKTIDLVYFNAGGGHRAAAQALQRRDRGQQRRPWHVRLVNLIEVLDPQGPLPPGHRLRRPRTSTTSAWRSGWTLGLAQELKLLQGMIRLGHATAGARAAGSTGCATEPDLVVSLVPNFNRALYEAVGSAAGRALRDGADRHGGPSAALLDRAGPGPAPRLRQRAGRGAGAGGGLPAQRDLADLGNDPAAGVLRAGGASTAMRSGRVSASIPNARPAW